MYKVLIDTLNHAGRKRQPGELIDMSEADAAPLLKIGAVAESPEESPAPDQDGQDPETESAGKKTGKTKAK